MSLHPSLRIDSAGAAQRTVLTRIERIKDLMKKGQWVEGQSATGLPKTKILKLKTRKEKKVAAAEGAAGAAAPAAGAAAKPAAKPAAKK
jgi:small basic protein (TIGR04137 family)